MWCYEELLFSNKPDFIPWWKCKLGSYRLKVQIKYLRFLFRHWISITEYFYWKSTVQCQKNRCPISLSSAHWSQQIKGDHQVQLTKENCVLERSTLWLQRNYVWKKFPTQKLMSSLRKWELHINLKINNFNFGICSVLLSTFKNQY